MNFRKLFFMVSFIMVSILLTNSLSISGEPKQGGLLVVGASADPTGLDPITARGSHSFQPMVQMFDGLTRYEESTFKVIPALATSWKVSPDGLIYTFHLRKGVTFHDGTPFDANALFFNMDRILNKENPYHPGARMGQIPIIYGLVENYKVIDDFTFQYKLKKPYSPFLACLSMAPAGIVSPAGVKKYNKDFFKNPVGIGAFVFQEWVKGDHLTMGANKDYWDGRPHINSLIYRVIPENSVRLLKLEKGEVQLLTSVGSNDIHRIQKNKDLTLYETPGMLFMGISVNLERKPFDDVRVRKALSHAINKEEFCKTIMKVGTPGESLLPKTNWGFDENLDGHPFDLEKAKALLAEAGYPKGFEAELVVRPGATVSNPSGMQTWQAIQSYWNKIGVRTKIKVVELNAFYNILLSGKNEWEITSGGWNADNGDPDAFLEQRFHSASWLNYMHYNNPQVDKILTEARQVSDREKRKELYAKAQKIMVDKDLAECPLCDMKLIWASRANLMNFNPKLKAYEHLDKVWFD